MSIGQALAEARQQAGLTVTDVSQRTRIREGIIRGIEADEFSVCGGDFYARGHIRSIAKVIGADPAPLVAEYDQVWRDRGGSTDVRHVMDLITESRAAPTEAGTPLAAGPATAPPGTPDAGPVRKPGSRAGEVPGTGPPGVPGAGPVSERGTGHPGEPRTGLPGVPGAGPVSERGAGHPGEHRTGQPDGPDSAPWGTSSPVPWRPTAPGRRLPGSRPPRRLNWTIVLAVAVVLSLGLIGYQLMSGSGGQPPAAAPSASGRAGAQHPAEHGTGTTVPQRTPVTGTPTPPGASVPPAVASKSLTPASAEAFGIGGAGAGDNAGLAHLAVDGSPGSAWHTDWYTSASFGNLYSGTGLLVDLGHRATIIGARIALGSAPGAAFELRAGSSPGALRTVARAGSASGVVNMRLGRPVQGRYLLIWFTRLPDDAGTFEASVHDVKVTVRT